MPPETPLEAVFPSQAAGDGSAPLAPDENTARRWFAKQLPRLVAARTPGLAVFEQLPGEVLFVPAGYWHCALNLDAVSVAVTQNYLGEGAFEAAAAKVAPDTAERWRARAKEAGLL